MTYKLRRSSLCGFPHHSLTLSLMYAHIWVIQCFILEPSHLHVFSLCVRGKVYTPMTTRKTVFLHFQVVDDKIKYFEPNVSHHVRSLFTFNFFLDKIFIFLPSITRRLNFATHSNDLLAVCILTNY
jgi:hypothetical protein